MTNNKQWPSDFPEGVPPEDAVAEDIMLVRAIKKEVEIPTEKDFLPSYKDTEQLKTRYRRQLVMDIADDPDKSPDELLEKYLIELKDNSRFYAVSFFSDLSELKSRVPALLKSKNAFEAKISKDMGKHKGNKGHISVWFYEGEYPKGCQML